jgi:DNA-binding PadR family transcriptional regulator
LQTFLTKERAALKICLIHAIEQNPSYGWAYRSSIAETTAGFSPSKSETYKALHELAAAGIVRRTKRLRNEGGFQEIIVYTFAADGYAKAQQYKQLVKTDLERSRTLIDHLLKHCF